jgi:hypothetical protein
MSVIYYIGLDVHKDTVAVAIAPSDSAEIGQYAWSAALSTPSTNPSGNSPKPDVELRFVYKAGLCGYAIYRHLKQRDFHWTSCLPRANSPGSSGLSPVRSKHPRNSNPARSVAPEPTVVRTYTLDATRKYKKEALKK